MIGPMHNIDIQNLFDAFASLKRDKWLKAFNLCDKRKE